MSEEVKKVYLDYAAATPVRAEVLEAMRPYFSDVFYNPSAIYQSSRGVKATIEQARHSVAMQIGARPDEIIFTAGATESINLAISGIMSGFDSANVVVSTIEHEAVLKAAGQYDTRQVSVDQQGSVDREDLKQKVDDNTALISIIYANNEIGTVQDLPQIAEFINQVRLDRKQRGIETPIFLHTDAAQAGAYLDLHVSRLNVDMLTLNGGKMYGPKQSGILYVKSSAQASLRPIIYGGGQEMGLRSGTENVANIVGFTEALKVVQADRKEESKRLFDLQSMLTGLLEENFPGLTINGSKKKRLPNNVNFSLPGFDGERIVMGLDELGFECATGAACSANTDEVSHVLSAIGLDDEYANGSIRISMGKDTNESDIQGFVKVLKEVTSH